jgi:hypothetical protein
MAHREDVGLKALHQLAARGRITSQTAANERGVGGHVGPSSEGIPGRMEAGFKWNLSERVFVFRSVAF